MADNSGPLGVVNDEIHPDFDRSNQANVVRLVALSLNGWRIQRGRGPRNHGVCLYCRGDLTDATEIFVHEDGSCRNAWPVCCFLEMLDQDLKNTFRVVRCPVCRNGLFRTHEIDRFMILKVDGPTAVLRVTLFSPEFVIQCGLQERRPIIFMERNQMRSVAMFKDDANLLRDCSNIKREGESQTIRVNTQMAALGTVTPVFRAWVLIGFGYNIFRICTFLPQQMEELRSELVAGGANVRLMSAASFNAEAELRGGLTTTLDGILAGELDRNLKETEKVAEDFMCGSEGARELWAESSYFHLLKTLVAAGRGPKEIKNPRYRAFLESLPPPRHFPNNPFLGGMGSITEAEITNAWMMSGQIAGQTSGQGAPQQWPIAAPGQTLMELSYSLPNPNAAQNSHADDDEGAWDDEEDDEDDDDDYDEEDEDEDEDENENGTAQDGQDEGGGGAQGVENATAQVGDSATAP